MKKLYIICLSVFFLFLGVYFCDQVDNKKANAEFSECPFKIKTIEIGTWCMYNVYSQSKDYIELSLDIPIDDISSVSVLIHRDTFSYIPRTTPLSVGGSFEIEPNLIRVYRNDAGCYDSLGYGGTTINRGIVTIIYE